MRNQSPSFSVPGAQRQDSALLIAGALQNAILNSANFSSIATDAQGVIQIFNVGAQHMLGFAAADVVNKLSPADLSDPLELVARAAALSVELATPIAPGFDALVFKASRGLEDIYELTYIRKDGSRFPANVSVTALRDDHNTLIGYLLIGTDNTARKQAQQARDEALSLLQKIASRVPGMVYQCRMRPDGSFCFPFASDAIRTIYRVNPEDARHDAAQVFVNIHPDDYRNVVASIEASAQDLSPWSQEYRVKFDDGTVRWLFGSALAEREVDGGTLWHGFISDITERKKTEKALRQGELRLQATLDAIPDLLFEVDLEGRYHDFHSPRTDLLVAPAQNLIGQFVSATLPAKAVQVVMAALRETNELGFSTGKQFELTLAQGVKWFELSVSRKATEPGDDPHFIVLSRDITERKQVEQALVQYRGNLEHIVYSRTAELSAALRDSTDSRELLELEIKEHQRAEDRLLRSELILNQAARLAQLGAWSIELLDLENLDLNPAFCSQEMFRLLDYRSQKIPVLSLDVFFARIHPQDRQRVKDMAMQALTLRQTWQTEYRLVWADGSEHLVVQTGEFLCDATGTPKSMHGAVKDITAQRKLENLLRDSEIHLQMALKGAGAGSFDWNIETGVIYWSTDAWTLNGLASRPGPTDYKTWRQTINPDDLSSVECVMQAAMAQRVEFEVQWRVNLPPGSAPRWLMSRAQPLPEADGRVVRYHGITMDISKRREAEFSLEVYRDHLEERVIERTFELADAEAEQRRLNRALRLLSDCNMVLVHARSERQLLNDVCRLVVNAGDYLMAWVGMAAQDAAKTVRPVAQFGLSDGYLESISITWDGGSEFGEGPTGAAIRTGSTQIDQNCWRNPKMQPWLEAAVNRGYQSILSLPLIIGKKVLGALSLYAPEPDAFGMNEVQLLEELASDVAFGLQSLRARCDLEHYQQQLEELVAHRTREIDALNIELQIKARDAQAANLAKSAFLAAMSHELRTPLNAVIGLTGLLVDSPLGRLQRDYADKVQLSAQALRSLIDDILDFSRIEAGELRLEQASFSLNAILRNTAAVLGVGLRDKPIEALFDVSPNIPDALMGDALRLQQILLNLTSNAVKFTEAGEIVISVRCLVREADGVTLQFAVRDTGIGIAPEQLGPIFDRFTQAETSTSRLYGGSGLGLTICTRLAKLMQGQINVDSTLGQGSEFRFNVKLALAGEAQQVAPTALPANLNILIVDDHPLARDILLQACTAFGWQATAVESGAAGLLALRQRAAEEADYDLMLLDWRMPEMDGLEMLRQAYAASDFGLPLVVLMASIFELEQAVAASEDLTLDGVVAKPMTPSSLQEAVLRVFSGEPLAIAAPLARRACNLSCMRLLVAEDNALNQEVIVQILSRAGAQVVMVDNGLAAVTALRAPGADFDAVLMDIQMPVMDGYTATRIIREDLGLLALPIIAVTAFAQPEDREKSRLAGMVGHLVKPLNVDDLLDLVARARGGEMAHLTAMPDAGSQRAMPVVELAGLDVGAALKVFAGDQNKYWEILNKFVLQQGGDVEEALRRFKANDEPGALRLLHDLCGVAGLLQATELARLAKIAESALREGDAAVLPALFEKLQAAMQTLCASVLKLGAQSAVV